MSRPQRIIGPARIFRLGTEPRDDLMEVSTPEERWEMLLVLSARMWELQGGPAPLYERSTLPVNVIRRS